MPGGGVQAPALPLTVGRAYKPLLTKLIKNRVVRGAVRMIETEAKADFFKLRTPLLSKGRLDTELTRTDTMRVWMKCYAEGGENVLHAHPQEDHIFVILQGQARFHDKDDTERVLGRNEGIMLPAG